MTVTSFTTSSCPSKRTSPRSVEPATTNLRQLRSVARSLSVHATKTQVQAFISCRLDYCNSLLYGINDGLLRRLQSVQNAAARLVTGAGRRDHITPMLRRLHWLPVRQRVVFKVAELVHQSLDGVAPAYLINDCRLLSDAGRRPLRSSSSDIRTLVVPRTHLATEVFWLSVHESGMTFHLVYDSLDCHLQL